MDINTIGVATLCRREISRFLKVWNQTVVAPVITTLLFLAILTLAMGAGHRVVDGVDYAQFIAPGLVMMAVVQNAFANTSSSIMLGKIQGVIIDILMPPLTPSEIMFSLVVGGLVRGLLVGVAVMASLYLFVPFTLAHAWLGIFHIVAASTLLALLGLLAGLWSHTFDHLSAITNYIITPLAFLSGTFYSVKQLPVFWYNVCHFNPFFYMIDGFRYAIIGHTDGDVGTGIAVMLVSNMALWVATLALLRSGYRLKT